MARCNHPNPPPPSTTALPANTSHAPLGTGEAHPPLRTRRRMVITAPEEEENAAAAEATRGECECTVVCWERASGWRGDGGVGRTHTCPLWRRNAKPRSPRGADPPSAPARARRPLHAATGQQTHPGALQSQMPPTPYYAPSCSNRSSEARTQGEVQADDTARQGRGGTINGGATTRYALKRVQSNLHGV